MTFDEIVRDGESELIRFHESRDAAGRRLSTARNMCDASADQDYAVQAQATVDLEDAIAVASEWGLIQQSRGLR